MTNLSSESVNKLDSYAQELHTTKREIVEKAIKLYDKYMQERKIQDEYRKMAEDEGYLEEMELNSSFLGSL